MKKFLAFLLTLFIILALIEGIRWIGRALKNNDNLSLLSGTTSVIENPAWNQYPQFDNMEDLRDYLNEQKRSGNRNVTFLYTGSEELDGGDLAHMSASRSVSCEISGNKYSLTMTQYPGERIVDAHRSGDTSALSEEELQAMEIAVSMVEQAKVEAADSWELELNIHDILASHITYFTSDYNDSQGFLAWPRCTSAVGALLDGEANCQGYSDAFYTLASIAGFEVGKMSVITQDGGHQVNTIYLNDHWYIVDLTFDDNESYGVDYSHFNIGTDLVGKYDWESIYECNPIAETTDPTLFYYYRNRLAFESVQEFSQMVAQTWADTDQKVFPGMVKNEQNPGNLTDSLSAVLESIGKSYSYQYSYSSSGQNCFYNVVFE